MRSASFSCSGDVLIAESKPTLSKAHLKLKRFPIP
jgi:hypothetical protein